MSLQDEAIKARMSSPKMRLLSEDLSRDAWRCEQASALMRISLGLIYVAHGPLLKGFVFGIAGVVGYFESLGLPGFLAYLVLAAEGLGGLMLIFGIYPAFVALALLPVLIGAIVFDHGANGWLFSAAGGGWEYPAFLIAVSVAVIWGRGGAYTLRR